MNRSILTLVAAAVVAVTASRAAETFDAAMNRATEEYSRRLGVASEELNATRRRIADEKAPYLASIRQAEDRIVAAQSEIERLGTFGEDTVDEKRKLLLELDGLRKTTSYLATIAHDGLKAATDSLAPGESQLLGDRLQGLGQELDADASGPKGKASLDVVEFLLAHTRQELGGYAAPGSVLLAENNLLVKGTFGFSGPETYFTADSGGLSGTVRLREGAAYPASYGLDHWKKADAAAFFQGGEGAVPADASGGKALRLRETKGTVLQHIQKGGVVAYVILAVGMLSLLMIIQKVRDLSALAIDRPEVVAAFLTLLSEEGPAAAKHRVGTLQAPLRELFSTGLREVQRPKEVLEEHLQAVLLRQRLHFERRMPLLAVIATAAPLMGLLGTVVGMVRTFALITVFGTGNAGKLASGISEVLVATELGLVVAIPTLIAHGFLMHRIQRKLSLLERYALEFVTASGATRREEQTANP